MSPAVDSAGVETKVTAATLAALVLPAIDAFLSLLIAGGAGITPEFRNAIVDFVQWMLPVIVFIVAYRAPHTFRFDLEYDPPRVRTRD